MVQVKAKIIYNKRTRGNYYYASFSAPSIAKEASPGQFVTIRVSNGREALLRRPLSIHRANALKIEFMYEVVGKGTEILSQKKTGEYLDVIGPLGNGFDYRLPITDYRLPILVAGGMGVAPLVFLAEKLRGIKNIALIGAKTKNQILCEKEFKDLGCEVKISTDDGSRGFKGRATDLLQDLLRAMSQEPRAAIYACGPRPMLKEVSSISKRHNIPAQLSLEEHMACGIGACLGCAVETRDGYKRVCKDGPVFTADEIIW